MHSFSILLYWSWRILIMHKLVKCLQKNPNFSSEQNGMKNIYNCCERYISMENKKFTFSSFDLNLIFRQGAETTLPLPASRLVATSCLATTPRLATTPCLSAAPCQAHLTGLPLGYCAKRILEEYIICRFCFSLFRWYRTWLYGELTQHS